MKASKHVLTREMLSAGGIERMLKDVPNLHVLSEAERAESLASLLERRPPGDGGAWVFAYGSLIWNPAVHYAERRFARVHGWHRSFCLSTHAGRGSPEAPGLVLGLDSGGACTGAAFRIEEAILTEELTLLWRREMVSGAYQPRWVAVRDKQGAPFGLAIAFTIHRTGHHYAGGLADEEIALRLATAAGGLGSSAEYLFQTRDGLRQLGIEDKRIERLARRVEQIRRASDV